MKKKKLKQKKHPAPKGRRGQGHPAPQGHRAQQRAALGIYEGNRRGFGFVRISEEEPTVFVAARNGMGALDGDTVRLLITRMGDRPEGEITEIVTRARETVIGTVVKDTDIDLRPRGEIYLLPDNTRLPAFEMSPAGCARVGEKVEVRIPYKGGYAPFVRSFGRATSRKANYAAVLAECAVPTAFSPEALDEAADRAAEPLSTEGRRIVHDTVLTIDGAGAKDLDDAISLRRAGDGYILTVHIADVSHYVRPFSALDATAHERGSSVYFTDRVVPMLPEALSNGACSLNAGEDKYALSAEMTLDAEGEIKKTKLYKSIINSRMRGVYSEVNDLFEKEKASEFYPKYRGVYAALTRMRELYRILAARDARRGVLELETPEPIILLDGDGNPIDIRREERGEAERLIEAFMLMANRAVAEELTRRGIPCVYRIHEPPPPEKYESLCEYLTALSLPIPWRHNEDPSALALRRVLEAAAERDLGAPVSATVLRSLAKARYAAAPSPHFGLSLSLYCHFTSPIRRLSDLVTHRIISAVLIGGDAPAKYRAAARRGANAATDGEIRAVTAERRIEALYKTIYMRGFVGKVFSGRISSVTAFGYYVELDNTCEGLVPTSLLDGEWKYDERRRTLSRNGTVLTIGDEVMIRVRDADVPTQHITFEPYTEDAES